MISPKLGRTLFERKARRNKKAFLSNQSKEIEENSRMEKTRDIFKRIERSREYFTHRWAQLKTEKVRT